MTLINTVFFRQDNKIAVDFFGQQGVLRQVFSPPKHRGAKALPASTADFVGLQINLLLAENS